jgi:hypothetical protein
VFGVSVVGVPHVYPVLVNTGVLGFGKLSKVRLRELATK